MYMEEKGFGEKSVKSQRGMCLAAAVWGAVDIWYFITLIYFHKISSF